MKSIASLNGDGVAGIGDSLPAVEPITDYRPLSKLFHWLTAALVFVMVSSGVIAKQLDGGEVAGTLLILHKTTGILTLIVVAIRIIYRMTRFDPTGSARADRRPGLHWILYGTILLVPLLGWAGVSDFGARGILFGYSLPAIWPQGAGYADLLLQLHAYVAFALLALVAVHIGVAMQDYMTRGRPDDSRDGD
jgi:cytochrome b561